MAIILFMVETVGSSTFSILFGGGNIWLRKLWAKLWRGIFSRVV